MTYGLVAGPAGLTVSAAGLLAWTPTFAQVGGPYAVTVSVQDQKGLAAVANTTANLTVVSARLRGDADGANDVDPPDATLVLRMNVGLELEPVAGDEDFYGADANADANIAAIDASWILYFLAFGEYPDLTMPKMIAQGEVGFAGARAVSEYI